ncbi:HAMP domain-containing histidine kinase [Cellulophaga sp. 20_2_10]|uniref:sensor histidine kinase n=1 Tax=Cellulophaga sp. 20_2_10 TaxID=2942476 RepID=UPI00201B220F|nr:HAMP domain-containing sensor histidine kinase [Cellulophaga sp. 20_2_10]MCL5246725.1 HAMP domain-containing histidine kinase [Cellulophaga sp. 20_2_10]
MNFNPKNKTINISLMVSAFFIVSLILWNTNSFFEQFKKEERHKMEIWATAQSEFLNSSQTQDLGDLHLKIFQNNTSTPMILVNKNGSFNAKNIENSKTKDTSFIQEKIEEFKTENTPVLMTHKGELIATLYYGNSEVLNNLKYYPLALLLIICLFGAVIFFFFKTNKASEQSKLWAGMAKETAHQIGTPLTSLLGWNELLKDENINPEISVEIEKDIDRLQTITDRFSNIGSLPKLEEKDIVAETKSAFDYLKRRSSKLIQFSFDSKIDSLSVMLNKPLYNWTIENLVKNGIDAMRGKGHIAIEIVQAGNSVNILVSDTGHGIPKRNYATIFNPGHTSKRRGWGLGLSLVKRIVEEYHNGKVKVLSSSKDGTVMQISLKTKV